MLALSDVTSATASAVKATSSVTSLAKVNVHKLYARHNTRRSDVSFFIFRLLIIIIKLIPNGLNYSKKIISLS